MKTVRQEIEQAERLGALEPGHLSALDELECRIWRKWGELKRGGVLKLLAGVIESKVLRPILGERPAGCR